MADFDGFDAGQIDPLSKFAPLPAGKYLAAITASDEKQTKAMNGSFVELKFEILTGPFKGRVLLKRLNLKNLSEVAVRFAKAELSAICRAVGVMTPHDSSELHNRPLVITVVCETLPITGQIVNEIRTYEKHCDQPSPPSSPTV